MSQILRTIEDALSEVLEERVTNLSMATDLQVDLDLDSIRFVQFLLTLEDKIPGLLFNPDTLNQFSFNRVETLIDYIESERRAGEVSYGLYPLSQETGRFISPGTTRCPFRGANGVRRGGGRVSRLSHLQWLCGSSWLPDSTDRMRRRHNG
jgi:acyl carrier protein